MARRNVYGAITRGTTFPNRLRRVDRYLIYRSHRVLRDRALVIDLGFGVNPVTTLELAERIAAAGSSAQVLGLEIDPQRVADAAPLRRDGVDFALGGFELAGRRPTVVRAMNVLRQYDESEVAGAWDRMRAALAPGGLVFEGTCDELGRLGSWVTLDASGPVSLTCSWRLTGVVDPADVAQRLPKALIHRNVPGEPVHNFLAALRNAWARAAPHGALSPMQRFRHTAITLRANGWPIADGPKRWRLGELTVAWSAVAPR